MLQPFPKKKLGQHFLIDRNIVRKIVSLADVREGERVLEVGPGTGVLTEELLRAGAAVTAIEADAALAEKLREKFKDEKALEVVTADALKLSFLDLSKKAPGGVGKFKVVANLPYNISGPILVKFLEEREVFTSLVLMFQKEVARRITAGPGTKEYGILSVLSRAYTDARCEFDVAPHLFRPPPKVTSTVVRLSVLPSPRVPIEDEKFFKRVVRAAFGQRRKTLHNALKLLALPDEDVSKALEAASIDPKRRGETLTGEEFGRLADLLKGRNAEIMEIKELREIKGIKEIKGN
ncbi:MAG: 16S rRNA (adenine(1518)-N(6)/adenine(1519)-N(6))-dimethyltransferase RsmA [Thermodesulfobacteriota bacterium]